MLKHDAWSEVDWSRCDFRNDRRATMSNDSVYLDERFYIKELTINTPHIYDAILEGNELVVDAFCEDTSFRNTYGHDYDMRECALEQIFATEKNVKKRLSKFIEQARIRRNIVLCNTDKYYRRCVITPGVRTWAVYDAKHPDGPRMAAFCAISDIRHKQLKMGFWRSFYVKWLTFWDAIKNYFRFFWTKEYSFSNSRTAKINELLQSITGLPDEDSEEVIDMLAKSSEETLAREKYPHSYHYYLQIFAVCMYYQRQGLGWKMLKYVVSQIPTDKKPEFVSKDGQHRSYGRPRLHLHGSELGYPLYKKFGFKLINKSGEPDKVVRDGKNVFYAASMVYDLD